MRGVRERSSWARPSVALGVLMALVEPAVADDPRPRATPAGDPPVSTAVPSDPSFGALLTDGSAIAGRIVQVDAARGITLAGAGGEERTIAVDRVVKLTRDGVAAVPSVEGDILLLPGGDRLTRCIIGAAGDAAVDVSWESMSGHLAVPLDAIIGMIFAAPKRADAAYALEARVRGESRAAEQLWLSNGDTLDGLFAGMTEKQIFFQPPTGRVALSRADGVIAVGFNPAQVVEQPVAGPSFEWSLLDGSRLGLGPTRLDRGQVVGRTRSASRSGSPSARWRGSGCSAPAWPTCRTAMPTRSSTSRTSGRPVPTGAGPAWPVPRSAWEGRRTTGDWGRRAGPCSRTGSIPGRSGSRPPSGSTTRRGRWAMSSSRSWSTASPATGRRAWAPATPPGWWTSRSGGGKVLILTTEFGERGDVQDSGDWVEARVIR